MRQIIKIIHIKPLSKKHKKKYIAKFEIIKSNGKKSYITTKFGENGMSDFTIHKDIKRRNRYINRHKKDLRTNKPYMAGYLSMYILWNKKTFKASLTDYKRRLNSYNKTGKFNKEIPNSPLKSKFGKYTKSAIIKNVNKFNDYYANKSKENNFGKVYLYKFLVDKTRFRDLPPDIISLIEQKLQISDIIKQYRTYKEKKLLLKSITEEFGQRQTDSPYEYVFDWDPNEEQSAEWLEEASKLLTKTDIEKPFWKETISKFIIGFIENQRGNKTFDISEKSIVILLNKLKFNPIINISDQIPFYSRLDILEYFGINQVNQFGKDKDKVPKNVKNPKLYLRIKYKIKKEVNKKKRRWGAYDSGRLVKEYKQSGGKYTGKKTRNLYDFYSKTDLRT